MVSEIFILLFWLLAGHAFADMALQPADMAKGKNRNRQTDYVPPGQKYVSCWPYWLSAHAIIHGAFVAMATGMVWLGVCETVTHWIIDFFKCENAYTPHGDQALHFVCKVAWIVLWIFCGGL